MKPTGSTPPSPAMVALLRLRQARERLRAARIELCSAELDELLAERDYIDKKQNVLMQQGGPVAKVPTMVPKADLMGPEVTDRSTGLPSCIRGERCSSH